MKRWPIFFLGILLIALLAGCGDARFTGVTPTATSSNTATSTLSPTPSDTPTPSATPTDTPDFGASAEAMIQGAGTEIAQTAAAAQDEVSAWGTAIAGTNVAASNDLYTAVAELNASETQVALPTITLTPSMIPTPLPDFVATAESLQTLQNSLLTLAAELEITQTALWMPTLPPMIDITATLPPALDPFASTATAIVQSATETAYAVNATASEEYWATTSAGLTATAVSGVTSISLGAGNIQAEIPPGFTGPEMTGILATLRYEGGEPTDGITFAVTDTVSLFGTLFTGRRPPEADQDDPVIVLRAALILPSDTPTEITVLREAEDYPGLPYPAAHARLQMAGIDGETEVVLLRTGDDQWLTVLFTGPADLIEQWADTVLPEIAVSSGPGPTPTPTAIPTADFLPSPTPVMPPTPAPTPESTLDLPTGAVTEPTTVNAYGLTFTIPAGWSANETGYDSYSYTMPGVSLSGPGDQAIWAIRSDAENLLGIDPGDTDTVTLLQNRTERSLSDTQYTLGRYREIQIGDFAGAWTQFHDDVVTIRNYLFRLGADDWLLIGARASRRAFSGFAQTTFGDFLDSLALQGGSSGIALGLDFAVPAGWAVGEPPEGFYGAPAVTIMWAGAALDTRQINIARGSAADFAGLGLSASETDPAAGLRAIVDFIRTERTDLGGGRVEEVQVGDFTGAWASLRSDEIVLRLYLFAAGQDDWILVAAEGPREGFNAFAQNELRELLASLQLAGGGGGPVMPPPGPMEEATVLEVTDGDTIVVLLNGHEERVRYIGVDTPETHHPDFGAEWLGYEATRFHGSLVQAGDTVWLESDVSDRDIYNRLLRYIWVEDVSGERVMVNAELLRAGLAQVITYDERRYVNYFLALEREAQQANLGIWGERPAPPPVDSLAEIDDEVWAANPDGDTMPLLYDAAALGNVPDPVAWWPNNVPVTVRDVFYVYDEGVYWYWLEINDFRGWVPESWIMTEAQDDPPAPPETRIIAYDWAAPLDDPAQVYELPGEENILAGEFAPGAEFQVTRLSIGPEGDWWLYAETDGLDGWVHLDEVQRLRPG